MNSRSWKKLFMPKINTKAAKPITITGEKTVLRPKQKKDIQNDFKWRTDIELSELDATLPINLSYEQFVELAINAV